MTTMPGVRPRVVKTMSEISTMPASAGEGLGLALVAEEGARAHDGGPAGADNLGAGGVEDGALDKVRAAWKEDEATNVTAEQLVDGVCLVACAVVADVAAGGCGDDDSAGREIFELRLGAVKEVA
jgi:hypothetical protein